MTGRARIALSVFPQQGMFSQTINVTLSFTNHVVAALLEDIRYATN